MLPQAMPPRARRAAGTTEPRGLVPALVLLGFGLTALCGVVALLFWNQGPAPSPTPDLPALAASAAPSVTPAPSTIQGLVWEDVCNEHQPSTPACVLDASGGYRANGIMDPGERGLGGLLVALGLGPCPAAPILTPLTQPDGAYTFGGLPAGAYCVSVDPASAQNVDLVPGGWSWPASGAAVAAQVTVNLGAGQTAAVNFGWDRHEQAPTTTPTPSPPAASTSTVVFGCSNYAAFMADVTIPDQTVLPGNAPFTKTWRVLNTGSCPWEPSYALVFDSGEAMGGPVNLPFSKTVAPGSTLDLSIALVAPASAGPHAGAWRLRSGSGETFGTGPDAAGPLQVRIVVSGTFATPTPTPAPPAWHAAFYNNRDLSGPAALSRTESTLFLAHDWGLNAPAPAVMANDFSARWTGTPLFDDGVYRFYLTVDDGARLWLDGELVIDDWRAAGRRELVVERTLLAGALPVRLEYFETINEAVAQLRWERIGAYPYWNGEYWPNNSLSGSPAVVRQDARLDFAWGTGSPQTGLPADNFSARWVRTAPFDAGAYRFHVLVDDGARVWVDDRLVVDAWAGGPVREVTGDVGLAAGPHTVRVEFVDYTLDARLAVWWEPLAAMAFPDWKAEFWSNTDLAGVPLLVRNDPGPDVAWEAAAPAVGVPSDNFSVRWTKTVTLTTGLYRFYALADDGVRVSVGPERVIDEWHLSDGTAEYHADLALSGAYPIVVEYFDRTLTARVRVRWERLGDAPLMLPARPERQR